MRRRWTFGRRTSRSRALTTASAHASASPSEPLTTITKRDQWKILLSFCYRPSDGYFRLSALLEEHRPTPFVSTQQPAPLKMLLKRLPLPELNPPCLSLYPPTPPLLPTKPLCAPLFWQHAGCAAQDVAEAPGAARAKPPSNKCLPLLNPSPSFGSTQPAPLEMLLKRLPLPELNRSRA
jgi:hypothetical protein